MITSHSRGFTLIEILVYISVLLLTTAVVIAVFFSLRDAFERTRAERQLADSASSILERFMREVREADTVLPGTMLNINQGVLEIGAGATTTQFFLDINAGDVHVLQGGAGSIPLDPPSVVVQRLLFSQYGSGTSTAIRIEVDLAIDTPAFSKTETFYTTAVLRGAYEQ